MDRNHEEEKLRSELTELYQIFFTAKHNSTAYLETQARLISILETLHPNTTPRIYRHGQSLLATLRKKEEITRQFALLREGQEEYSYYPQAFVDLQSGQRLTDFVYCEISEFNCNGLIRARRVFPPQRAVPRSEGSTGISLREYERDSFLEHYGHEYVNGQGKIIIPASRNSILPEFYDGGELILKTFYHSDRRGGFVLYNQSGKLLTEWGFDHPSLETSDTCEILGNVAKVDAITETRGRDITRELFLLNSDGENVLGDTPIESAESLVEEDVPAPDLGQAENSKAPKFFRSTTRILVGAKRKFGVLDAQTGHRLIVPIEYDREKAIELDKGAQ